MAGLGRMRHLSLVSLTPTGCQQKAGKLLTDEFLVRNPGDFKPRFLDSGFRRNEREAWPRATR
jgi:hypothetical protein